MSLIPKINGGVVRLPESVPRVFQRLGLPWTLLLLLNGLILAWGLNRGFDILDEAFAMLNFHWPDAYRFGSSFAAIINRFPGTATFTLMDYRITGTVLRILAVIPFCLCFRYWLIHELDQRGRAIPWYLGIPPLLTLFLLSDWFIYSRYHPGLSYHTMNQACLYTATGLVLLFLAFRRQDECAPWKTYGALALAGVLTGLDLFIKFPTSIGFSGVTLALLLIDSRIRKGASFSKALLSFVGGYTLGMAGFFALVTAPGVWWHNLTSGIQRTAAEDGHTLSQVLNKYLKGYIQLWRLPLTKALPGTLTVIGLLFAINFLPARNFRLPLKLIVLSGVMVLLAWSVWDRFLFAYGLTHYFWLFSLLLLAAFALDPEKTSPRRDFTWLYFLLIVLYLSVLNFMGILGSSTGIHTSFSSYMTLPTAALLLLITLQPNKKTQGLLSVLLIVTLQAFWVWLYVYAGNRYHYPRIIQTTPVSDVPMLRGVQLEPNKSAFFKRLYAIVQSARQSSSPPTVVGIVNMPGLVYAVEGFPPSAPDTPWEHPGPNYCDVLAGVEQRHRPGDWFALVQEYRPPGTAACTERFIRNFTLVDEIWNPTNYFKLRIYHRYDSSNPS